VTALALVKERLGNSQHDDLWALIHPNLLSTLGWGSDKVLNFPQDDPIFGWTTCHVAGCEKDGRARGGLCASCRARWQETGCLPLEEFLKTATPRDRAIGVKRCVVPRCQRPWKSAPSQLCDAHHWQRLKRLRLPIADFLRHPEVVPHPSFGPCDVLACTRDRGGTGPLCLAHRHRAETMARRDPTFELTTWCRTAPAIPEVGKASLRGLPSRLTSEVLYGIQERARTGSKINYFNVRTLCDKARFHAAVSLDEIPTDVLSRDQAYLRSTFVTAVRRARSTPETERHKDVWDLAVFGHSRTLTFAGISQPWLKQAAKQWALDDLPQRRGRQIGAVVQARIKALALLSDSLRLQRDDHGLVVAALSRRDISAFCSRLAYLAAQGTISEHRRVTVARLVRHMLDRMRTLGLVEAGQPMHGLPAGFALGDGDIPDEAEEAETGHDLPTEVMRHLCEHLPALEAQSARSIRTAVELMIDTGRRPHEICSLDLDCLERDQDDKPVLIYDNHKANRQARRLPVAGTTAALIVEQQERVRARFPQTPTAQLKLFPSTTRNPQGRNAISAEWVGQRHRDWVGSLPPIEVPTAVEQNGHLVTKMLPFDKAKIYPYAYRHTYAQRHADAGVDVTVLKELMDHRLLSTTQGYYRVGEERRREAVERVTTMQFDRHGNRIWRQAKALLDSEHLRRAVGEVAVPYGGCSEPSNVAAGGHDCPLRFRCIGCGHFSTDISYLPDLERYFADLLRHRERLTATLDADEWARNDAMPSAQEITRVRRLINRMKGDLDQLTAEDRTQIENAVTQVRRNRIKIVNLGLPRVRQPLPDLRPERIA
jgi:integrase